jgi:hypothetical protein
MKSAIFRIIALGMIFFFVTGGLVIAQKSEKIITIRDLRNKGIPSTDVANHRDMDVDIVRTNFNRTDSYGFIIYKKVKGSLKSFWPLSKSMKDEYNKAAIAWDNDSCVTIRIFNSATNLSMKLRITGKAFTSWEQVQE